MATTEAISPGIEPMLFLLVTCIAVILLLALVSCYLKFSGDIAKLRASVVECEVKLVKCTNENLRLQEAVLQAKREATASGIGLPPRNPPMQSAVAITSTSLQAGVNQSSALGESEMGTGGSMVASGPLTTVAAVKAESAKLTYGIVHEAILGSIASLAENRSSLTEANFINKVAGFTTDAAVKAVLLANLEPALFFLCSGARSPQGPELVAYRFKGLPDYSVVPYPSAGRVGQFNRWFENAASPYGVSPVLASKAAIGVIGEDGNLSVRTLGVLA